MTLIMIADQWKASSVQTKAIVSTSNIERSHTRMGYNDPFSAMQHIQFSLQTCPCHCLIDAEESQCPDDP